MPMPTETDTTSPKYLRDKYAIVGVGETTYTRGSGITTRALGTWAVRNAILDAGLKASRHRRHAVLPVGRLRPSRPSSPATSASASTSTWTCSAAAPRPRRWSASRSALIEAGMCKTVAIFRAMNGFSPGAHRRHRRALGGAGRPATCCTTAPMAGRAPGQMFSPTFMRHMYDYGTHAGAGRRRQGDPQRARLEQPQGLLQEALHGRGRAEQPHHLQAAASARLLRRDRQRHRASSSPAPSGRGTAASRAS